MAIARNPVFGNAERIQFSMTAPPCLDPANATTGAIFDLITPGVRSLGFFMPGSKPPKKFSI
jgi:hypothetical protein